MLDESFEKIYRAFRLEYYKHFFSVLRERAGSLSAAEISSVEVIYLLNEPTMKEFADYIDISPPNATYKVNNLVAKGYACKTISEDDKRECRVTVGERFYKYYGNSTRFIDNAVDALREDYSEDELKTFEKVLHSLNRHIEKREETTL